MGKTTRRKVAYRKRTQNRFSIALVALVVLLITVAVAMRSVELQQRIGMKDAEIEELTAQIEDEEKRTIEIDEFRKKTQTKGYYEEVAKEKLGLVYDGEIIFQKEK